MELFVFSLVALTLAHCANGEVYKVKGEECDPTADSDNRCAYRLYCRAPEAHGNGTCELMPSYVLSDTSVKNCLLEGSACDVGRYRRRKCCHGQICDRGTCRQLPNGTFIDEIKEPTCRRLRSSCGDCATCWDCCGDNQCVMTPLIKGYCRHPGYWNYSDQ